MRDGKVSTQITNFSSVWRIFSNSRNNLRWVNWAIIFGIDPVAWIWKPLNVNWFVDLRFHFVVSCNIFKFYFRLMRNTKTNFERYTFIHLPRFYLVKRWNTMFNIQMAIFRLSKHFSLEFPFTSNAFFFRNNIVSMGKSFSSSETIVWYGSR